MARQRELPRGVTATVDRHGKERFRYRRGGLDFYMKAHPHSREGKKLIADAEKGIIPRQSRTIAGSIGDLFERFYASGRFTRGGAKWQALVKSSLEEFRNEAARIPVADFRYDHIERLLIRRATPTVVDGRKRGGPAAAERLQEQLTRLFDFAQNRLGWIDRNPAKEADSPVPERSKGYHTWTVDEIGQFRARHPLGTKARLAMEIALWTGLRRGDVAKFGPANVRAGRVVLVAGKTAKGVDVMLAPDLREAIEATQTAGATFLATTYGKPFTDAGLGNWFRERCDEAGLPHCSMHGLRKALVTAAADSGATQQELKALGQWSHDAEVATYAAGADQKRLADEGIQKVIASGTLSNHAKELDKCE